MIVQSLPDFAGDNAAHTIASLLATPITDGRPVNCKWFQVKNDTASGGNVIRCGGAETDATHGDPLTAGEADFFPPIAMASAMYDLSKQKVYVPTGATAHILVGW